MHSAWLFTLLNTVIEADSSDLSSWFLTGELRSVIVSFEDRASPYGAAIRARSIKR